MSHLDHRHSNQEMRKKSVCIRFQVAHCPLSFLYLLNLCNLVIYGAVLSVGCERSCSHMKRFRSQREHFFALKCSHMERSSSLFAGNRSDYPARCASS